MQADLKATNQIAAVLNCLAFLHLFWLFSWWTITFQKHFLVFWVSRQTYMYVTTYVCTCTVQTFSLFHTCVVLISLLFSIISEVKVRLNSPLFGVCGGTVRHLHWNTIRPLLQTPLRLIWTPLIWTVSFKSMCGQNSQHFL